MAVLDSKFSNFVDGGDLLVNDIVVGLRNGLNTRFSFQGVPNTYLPLAGGTMAGTIDMNSNPIIGLPAPTNPNDATSKTYVDTAISAALGSYLPLAGGTMTGVIAMGTNKITGLGTPTASTDAATKAYADLMLPLTGGTMSGIINMGSHKITNLTDPTNPQDAATKAYVDSTGSGTVSPGLINQVAWYAASGSAVSGLATIASGLLVTSAGSVPSIATDIPTAVTIGGAYIYRAGGTDVVVSDGGTGVSSFTAYAVICGGTTSTGALQSVSGLGSANQVLISQGAGALPTWGSVPGVTPAALTKTDDTNVTLTLGGTPTTALLQATSLTLGWTGQLGVSRGGTGLSAVTAHYLPIGNGTSALTLLAPSATSGIPLISQGVSADPAYGTAVVAGGGTGNTTFTAYSLICAGTTATGAFQNVVGLGTASQVLQSNGAGALPSWVTIPGATSAALTKGDDTNVTLTLGGTPSTALLTAASITAGWTGQLSLARGGTNASLTAANGAIPYSTASAFAFLAPGTSGQLLQSGGAGAPVWTTPTYPGASGTARKIIVSDGTNNVYSTETWAVPGTSGNVLTSNGTNWVSSAPATGSLTTNHIFVGSAGGVATDVAMSGDATIVASGALTIANNAVSNAKLAQMATLTIKGNNTGGTANALDLTVAQVLTMLGLKVDVAPTIQRLTSGSGTYTTPTSPRVPLYLKVTVKAGGGGGGNGGGAGGGGGGEGGTCISIITSPSATYTYAVGAGGAAQTTGSNSTFSAGSMLANGGMGNASSGSVVGGSSSGGNLDNSQGACGTNPSYVGSPYFGGVGGGEGGGIGGQSGAGGDGSSNGGGGGGGAGSSGGAGGIGGSGLITVEEYYQ